jgi:hypothetical protein
MRKLLTFLIALASVTLASVSGVLPFGYGFQGGCGGYNSGGGFSGGCAPGPTYTGPGDVFSTSPYAWFSCARGYNGAYANGTNSLCDVVITSTGVVACTIRVATTGFADLSGAYCAGSTTLATACAAGCSVTKMYNQVSPGTCDVVQATLASMPLLLLNSTPTGTLPAVQASGVVGTMQVSTCAAKSQPIAFPR